MKKVKMDNYWFSNSDLCESFTSDEDETNPLLEIPEECKFMKNKIESSEDFVLFVKTYNYWVVREIPLFAIEYALANKINANMFKDLGVLERKVVDILILLSNGKINEACLESGSINLCKLLISKYLVKGVYNLALKMDSAELFIFIYDFGYELPDKTLNLTIAIENTEILDYLMSKGVTIKPTQALVVTCIKKKKLDLVKKLHLSVEKFSRNLLYDAARADSLEILEYLHREKRYTIDKDALLAACQGNSLDCLKYLHQNKTPDIIFYCHHGLATPGMINYIVLEDNYNHELTNDRRKVTEVKLEKLDVNRLPCYYFLIKNHYTMTSIDMFCIAYLAGLISINHFIVRDFDAVEHLDHINAFIDSL